MHVANFAVNSWEVVDKMTYWNKPLSVEILKLFKHWGNQGLFLKIKIGPGVNCKLLARANRTIFEFY